MTMLSGRVFALFTDCLPFLDVPTACWRALTPPALACNVPRPNRPRMARTTLRYPELRKLAARYAPPRVPMHFAATILGATLHAAGASSATIRVYSKC
jgi:hypothetical protein